MRICAAPPSLALRTEQCNVEKLIPGQSFQEQSYNFNDSDWLCSNTKGVLERQGILKELGVNHHPNVFT